ncbi:MAG: hypothetical protein E7551_00690 [Ruminococcaceae bacterium]|nr:hypothetical protein [Oscillospiraceae bacterium]
MFSIAPISLCGLINIERGIFMKKVISVLLSVIIVCVSLFVPTVMADTDDSELLYDGGFEETKTGLLVQKQKYDGVTYENTHVWYRPSHNSEIVVDGTNKALKLNRFAYQSVEILENRTYILKFKAKGATSEFKILASLRNLRDRASILVSKNIAVSVSEDWVEYSAVFEVGSFFADVTDYALGLDTQSDNNSVLLDDISFKAIPEYKLTATATEGGTATVSDDVVKEGATVTFTAQPSVQYLFEGWFYVGATEPVSTDLVYNVTVTSDIDLIAKFVYNTELLYDGGFEQTETGYLVQKQKYDGVTFENTHVWYRPSHNSEIVVDGTNKALKLNRFAYQSVEILENRTYILKFKAKGATSEFKILASLRNLRDRASILVSKNIAVSVSEDWVEYSAVFEVGSFFADVTDYALGLDTQSDNNSVLLDDISFKAIPEYKLTATATEGGTATVSDDVVKEGATVTFTAEAMDGYEFVGWFYSNSTEALSVNRIYEVIVNSDISLIAKFKYVGLSLLYDGGFEATKLGSISYAQAYDTVTYESAHIWYKPSHSSEVVQDGMNKALKLARFAYQSVEISENTSYILKFKAKNASADLKLLVSLRNLKDRNQVFALVNSKTITAGQDWTEYSVVINVNNLLEGVTDYTLGLDAGAENSVLIDDITFKNNLSTAYNNAAALRTSEASSTGKNGLRIYNEIKKDWIEENNIVEFGSIAILTEKSNGVELSHQADGIIEGVAYKQNAQDMLLWDETESTYIYTAYLTSINEKNYDADIQVRTYAVDNKGNYYYGDIVVVSVFKVANSIDNGFSLNGNEPSKIDKVAFYTFISDTTKDNYLQWCQVNDYKIGELYNQKYID